MGSNVKTLRTQIEYLYGEASVREVNNQKSLFKGFLRIQFSNQDSVSKLIKDTPEGIETIKGREAGVVYVRDHSKVKFKAHIERTFLRQLAEDFRLTYGVTLTGVTRSNQGIIISTGIPYRTDVCLALDEMGVRFKENRSQGVTVLGKNENVFSSKIQKERDLYRAEVCITG